MTGIAQYTYNLFSNLPIDTDVECSYYHNGLILNSIDACNFNRSSKNDYLNNFKAFIRDKVPYSYEVHWLYKKNQFNKVIKSNNFDIYHEPNFISYPSKFNTINTIHDLSWIKFPIYHPKSRVNFMNKHIKETLKKSSRLIVDSNFVKKELVNNFDINHEKIDVIYLASTMLNIKPIKPKHIFFDGNNSNNYILFVGTLEPRKNLNNTIDAYIKLPKKIKNQYPLIIAGGHGWNFSEVLKKIKLLSITENIIHLGYVNKSELCYLYKYAYCFIYPSFYEGFGLPVIEAMSLSTPVITSINSAMDDVTKNSAIKVKPEDTNDISSKLKFLLDNPSEAIKYGKLGKERSKVFSWKKCAKETLESYKKSIS